MNQGDVSSIGASMNAEGRASMGSGAWSSEKRLKLESSNDVSWCESG